jgi:hypothetical protein
VVCELLSQSRIRLETFRFAVRSTLFVLEMESGLLVFGQGETGTIAGVVKDNKS